MTDTLENQVRALSQRVSSLENRMRCVQSDLIPGFRQRLDEVEAVVDRCEKHSRIAQADPEPIPGDSDRPTSPDELFMRGPMNVRVRGPKVWVTLSIALIVLGVVAWSAPRILTALRDEVQTAGGK